MQSLHSKVDFEFKRQSKTRVYKLKKNCNSIFITQFYLNFDDDSERKSQQEQLYSVLALVVDDYNKHGTYFDGGSKRSEGILQDFGSFREGLSTGN